MGGWRKAGAPAVPRGLIVNPRLVGLLARGLLGRLERDRTHIRQENLLMRAREDLDGLFQRHPFHRLDIVPVISMQTFDEMEGCRLSFVIGKTDKGWAARRARILEA